MWFDKNEKLGSRTIIYFVVRLLVFVHEMEIGYK